MGDKDRRKDEAKAQDKAAPRSDGVRALRPQGEHQVSMTPMPPAAPENKAIHPRRPLPPVPRGPGKKTN